MDQASRCRLGAAMKRVLTAAILVLALPVAASAQGWNGFYVGATGGYGWGTSNQTGLIPPPPAAPVIILDDAKFSTSGGLIGGGLGWNAQYGAWVFGVEGDYSYAAVSGHSGFCGTVGNSCGSRLESLGTLRGRLGAVVNDWMLYATGGWAFGEVSGFSTAKSSGQAMYTGWTVGAGIETRIAPQWAMKLEYLYTDLGDKDLYQAAVPGFPETLAYTVNTVRIGINYSFAPSVLAAPAPIVTKGPPLK
jgi:outer membrane immunogenic protein